MPNFFTQRLWEARRYRKYCQDELAQRTGLPWETINQLESGKLAPSFDNLMRLARALEIGTDFFSGRNSLQESIWR